MAGTASPSPLKKKKLPFKPTALRKASLPKPSESPEVEKSGCAGSAEEDDGLALFRRAREMAPIMAADLERRQERKQKRRQEREEKRRSSGSKRLHEDEDEDEVEVEDALRANELDIRISTEPSPSRDRVEELLTTDDSMTMAEDRFRDLVTPPPSKRSRVGTASSSKQPATRIEDAGYVIDASPSTRRLRSNSKRSTPRKQTNQPYSIPSNANVISLDSDDDLEPEVTTFTTTFKARRSSAEIIGHASPRYSPPPPPPPPPEEDDPYAIYEKQAAEEQARFAKANKTKTTEIVVTSTVQDSRGCCIKFTFDKHLRLVRDSWVALQAKHGVRLDIGPGEEIIMTWRRKKVYMVDTLRSLGIESLGDGRVAAAGGSGRRDGGLRNDATRVHMEVWTPKMFQEMEKEEDLRRRRDAGEVSEADDDAGDDAVQEPPPPEKIRVILKARDLEAVKLTARPETTVETLITGFRTQRAGQVDAEKEVLLRWDGEALEEHVTMEDAGIEDMDTIEVHIK